MKAVRIHEFGGEEVLKYEDAPIPEIQDDDLLVKVFATSVNPVDWKIREGHAKSLFPTKFPLTLGWDLAGEVTSIGTNIKNFKVGDSVYGRPSPTRNGAYAQYVAVKENEICLKPENISFIESATIPLVGLTAWQGLFDHGKLTPGQRVLIHAASGGVGTMAVQLAKWFNAYVIGTTSEKNKSFVKDLGADEVIDYKNGHFDKLSGIDLVLDLIGGQTQRQSLKVLKKGGRLITTVATEDMDTSEKEIHLENYMAQSLEFDSKLKKNL
ncbi:NADP-dependent oxidoreductase [Arachidicoccus sp.]|uniref:NADP-dependent oxidoreductase n=1 Tax=Arachidicoccus sp. TaxID=1872624 RepID=UPI003D1E3295